MTGRLDRAFALTGVAFVVGTVVVFIVAGSSPDSHDSASKVVSFYAKHHSRLNTAGYLLAIPAGLLALFTGALRQRLRRTDGGSIAATTAAIAGGTIAAVGLMIFGGASVAISDASGHVGASSMQTLNVLQDNSFIPAIGGFGVFLLASGIAIHQTRALPRWLAYPAMVLGVLTFTPIGWFAFLLGGIWTAVVSVTMAVRPAAPASVEPKRIVTPAGERVAVPS